MSILEYLTKKRNSTSEELKYNSIKEIVLDSTLNEESSKNELENMLVQKSNIIIEAYNKKHFIHSKYKIKKFNDIPRKGYRKILENNKLFTELFGEFYSSYDKVKESVECHPAVFFGCKKIIKTQTLNDLLVY